MFFRRDGGAGGEGLGEGEGEEEEEAAAAVAEDGGGRGNLQQQQWQWPKEKKRLEPIEKKLGLVFVIPTPEVNIFAKSSHFLDVRDFVLRAVKHKNL